MDKDILKSFELVSKFTNTNRNLIHFGIIIGLLAIAFMSVNHPIPVVGENMTISYINASVITGVGFSETGTINISTGIYNGTNNITSISEINNWSWYGNESNGKPWQVYIYFYNITDFNYPELFMRYFSKTGVPSSHLVDFQIYCPTHNEFVNLYPGITNNNFWLRFTRNEPDPMHFILLNGTVIFKFDHESNGNNNHVIQIDTARLIKTNV